jgi:hypothetical protein
MAMNLLVSAVAIALGAFAAASPRRAAEFWGSQKLIKLAPERKVSFIPWYRLFGILLWLVGVLFAVDSSRWIVCSSRSIRDRLRRSAIEKQALLQEHALKVLTIDSHLIFVRSLIFWAIRRQNTALWDTNLINIS